MPFFELDGDDLVPIRRLRPTSFHERDVEDLLWRDLEQVTGENLFKVKRQAELGSAGRPDMLALDDAGRVVVIEVKRDVDRSQLAQTLEYAGWARQTNLDEIAGLYHGGEASFWGDWMDFTDTSTPRTLTPDPKLFLVAATFQSRTRSALDFLAQHGVPVTVLEVSLLQDDEGRRFLDVEWEVEPLVDAAASEVPESDAAAADGASTTSASITTQDREHLSVTFKEVAEAVGAPVEVHWPRPRKREHYDGLLLPGGVIRSNGVDYSSPSGAAMGVAKLDAYDGWYAWRTDDGRTLAQWRHDIAATRAAEESETEDAPQD